MLDYSLFACFFHHEISTFKIFGEYNDIHPGVTNAIKYKEAIESNNPELVLIYKQPFTFVDYFWRTILTCDVKWLLIVPKDEKDGTRIYSELRGFGDSIHIKCADNIIIIKNIKPTFKEEYRKMLLFPVDYNINLDEFLGVKVNEQKVNCDVFCENDNLIQSLYSDYDFIYFGKEITKNTLLRNQMLGKLGFNMIANKDIVSGEISGIYTRKDYIKDAWILYLTKNKTLESNYIQECNLINTQDLSVY